MDDVVTCPCCGRMVWLRVAASWECPDCGEDVSVQVKYSLSETGEAVKAIGRQRVQRVRRRVDGDRSADVRQD